MWANMNDDNKNNFWEWFVNSKDSYLQLDNLAENEKELLLDQLLDQLHSYCDKLYFQIGGHETVEEKELIISAEGNIQYFSAAEELVKAAPQLPEWKIIALKPAAGIDFVTEHAGIRMDPKKLWFSPLENRNDPSKLGLRVFVTGYDTHRKKEHLFACYQMLDTILGEKENALNIQHVEIAEEPADKSKLHGMTELSGFINGRKAARGSGNT
jgi:hypothetical protein